MTKRQLNKLLLFYLLVFFFLYICSNLKDVIMSKFIQECAIAAMSALIINGTYTPEEAVNIAVGLSGELEKGGFITDPVKRGRPKKIREEKINEEHNVLAEKIKSVFCTSGKNPCEFKKLTEIEKEIGLENSDVRFLGKVLSGLGFKADKKRINGTQHRGYWVEKIM